MRTNTYYLLKDLLFNNGSYKIDPVAGEIISFTRYMNGSRLGTWSKKDKCITVTLRYYGESYKFYLQDVIAVSAGWDIENKKIGFKDGDPNNCKLENLYIK